MLNIAALFRVSLLEVYGGEFKQEKHRSEEEEEKKKQSEQRQGNHRRGSGPNPSSQLSLCVFRDCSLDSMLVLCKGRKEGRRERIKENARIIK